MTPDRRWDRQWGTTLLDPVLTRLEVEHLQLDSIGIVILDDGRFENDIA